MPEVEWTLERDDPRTGDTESIPGVLSGTYTPPTDARSYSHGDVKDLTFRVTATGQYLRLVGPEMDEARDVLREAGHENYLNERSYANFFRDSLEGPYDSPYPSENYGDYPGDDNRYYSRQFEVEPDDDHDSTDAYWDHWGPAKSTNRQQASYLRDDLLACDPPPPPTVWKRLLRDEEF